MTTDDINRKSYYFIEKIRYFKRVNKIPNYEGSIAHVPAKDISEFEIIDTPSFERIFEHNNKDSRIILSLKDKKYGFEEKEYKKYFEFIDEVYAFNHFNEKVTYKFIEEKVLFWIVDVFLNKKSNLELTYFIEDEINKATENRIYFFQILNLHINKPFKIGNVEITFFTKQFFDDLWEKYKYNEKYSAKDFDNNLRKFQGRVFASYQLNAEPEKGREIAFEECAYAVDVIKLYTPSISNPEIYCLLDLEEKINVNFQSESLSHIVDNPDKLFVSFNSKIDPLFLDDKVLEFMNEMRINIFSDFLENYDSSNELERLIKQSIRLFSIAISTKDLHFRIAQLITISESLLLEDDLKNDLEKKCKQRFSKVVYSDDKGTILRFKNEMFEMYQIRHSIIHKALRQKINFQYLVNFQISIIDLFQRLIIISKEIKNKSDLINFIDGKN